MKINQLRNKFLNNEELEAGCDEAGRGCLAGPVVAAAVIFPNDYTNNDLDDSKKINEKNRYLLRDQIEKDALYWDVGIVDNKTIDKINILKASIKAMHLALNKLKVMPGYIIVDGNKFFPYKEVTHYCIVKGDSKYLSIAAASILAKTYRDDIMRNLHREFPQYNWEKNKGYPTKEHRQAISHYGSCVYHRMSFQLLKPQLEIPFID